MEWSNAQDIIAPTTFLLSASVAWTALVMWYTCSKVAHIKILHNFWLIPVIIKFFFYCDGGRMVPYSNFFSNCLLSFGIHVAEKNELNSQGNNCNLLMRHLM